MSLLEPTLSVPLSEADRFLKAVIYGPWGAHKTVTSARLGGNSVLVAVEEGWSSILNHDDLDGRIQIAELGKLLDLSTTLVESIESGNHGVSGFANGKGADTLIVDTFSEIQEMSLDTILKDPKTLKFKRDHSDIPCWQDYQLSRNILRPHIRRLMTARCNVILVCHAREPKIDDRTGKLVAKTRPDFTDATLKLIGRHAQLMAYCWTEGEGHEVKRWVQVHPSETIQAKCRIGGIPTQVKADDLPRIIQEWRTFKNSKPENPKPKAKS